jgi:hypothetical protein
VDQRLSATLTGAVLGLALVVGLVLWTVGTDLGVMAAHWGLDADGDRIALLLDFGGIDPPTR